jgi:hypothetical protein
MPGWDRSVKALLAESGPELCTALQSMNIKSSDLRGHDLHAGMNYFQDA